jgi:uncharacterized membrane protein YraQ (UPF0718 family)
MDKLPAVALAALGQVGVTLRSAWPLLALSALIAALLGLYADRDRVSAFLQRKQGAGVLGATLVAAATPFCSCGTTALVIGMMSSLVPWAPIVAFMVASPLSSPQQLLYSASLFGWPFALVLFGSSLLLGLAGGGLAALAEGRGLLKDQARVRPRPSLREEGAPAPRPDLGTVAREIGLSALKLLAFFLPFAFIGYFLNGLIPHEWVSSVFGSGRAFGIPLAATLGIPFYINAEASLPLVRSFMDMGMSPGATLAFLITGAGTSFGAIAGALTIARWRVILLVVATLWLGSMILGFGYDLILAL